MQSKSRKLIIAILVLAIIITVIYIVIDKQNEGYAICEICGERYKEEVVEVQEVANTSIECCCCSGECEQLETSDSETCNTQELEICQAEDGNIQCENIESCVHLECNDGRKICPECLYEIHHPTSVEDLLKIEVSKYYKSNQEGKVFDVSNGINDLQTEFDSTVSIQSKISDFGELPSITLNKIVTDYLEITPNMCRNIENKVILTATIKNISNQNIVIPNNFIVSINGLVVRHSVENLTSISAGEQILIKIEIALNDIIYAGIKNLDKVAKITLHGLSITDTTGDLIDKCNIEFNLDMKNTLIELSGTLIGQSYNLDENEHPTNLVQLILKDIIKYDNFSVLQLALINDSGYELYFTASDIIVTDKNGIQSQVYSEQYKSAASTTTIIPIYLYGVDIKQCESVQFNYTFKDELAEIIDSNTIKVNIS